MPRPRSYVTDESQEPPFCVQIELTEGCNLRCQFCGLNGIRGKANDFKFMTVGLATRLANLLAKSGWSARLEFAMHGEPSANPEATDIVRVFRNTLGPAVPMMMTSNGYGMVKDPTAAVDGLLEYLNVLALDWYESVNLVPKVLAGYGGIHTPKHYPKNKDANPHRRRKPNEHDLVIVQDIAVATRGTHATLNNHCGCGSPPNADGVGKRCAKPFRELSVRWDGTVALCCNDWRGLYRCGDLTVQTLEQVWQSSAFRAARRKLYHGTRDFGPCEGCDALSYRPGLLPDKKGRSKLPVPNQRDQAAIEAALGKGPLTQPVLRRWELPQVRPERA